MTGEQYLSATEELGMSQIGSARFFGVDYSTVRRWVAGTSPVPDAVAYLLRVMMKTELTPHHVQAIDALMDKTVALEASDG